MSEKRGCFKTGLFGCLGIIVILTVLVGSTALVAWNRSGKVHVEEKVLTSASAGAPTTVRGAKVTEVPAGIGRVVLDLAQGEFEIHPDQPGRGVGIERHDVVDHAQPRQQLHPFGQRHDRPAGPL